MKLSLNRHGVGLLNQMALLVTMEKSITGKTLMCTHLQCLNKVFHYIIPEQIFSELNFTCTFSWKMTKDCPHVFGDRNFSLFLISPRKPTASWTAPKDW